MRSIKLALNGIFLLIAYLPRTQTKIPEYQATFLAWNSSDKLYQPTDGISSYNATDHSSCCQIFKVKMMQYNKKNFKLQLQDF